MTHKSPTKLMSVSRVALLILALAAAGCNREKVTVQQVPKDSEQSSPMPLMSQGASAMPANPHAGMDMSGGMGDQARPKLNYTLPAGWKEKDLGQMRVASFEAPGKDGQIADISVIPLQGMPADAEVQNVNMWRGAVGLPNSDKAESEPVTVGSSPGKLYDVGGEKATGRIIVAVLDKDGASWYFKMSGPDAAVRDQKAAFIDFLKSVSFEAAPATAAANPHAGMTMDAPPASATPSTSTPGLPAGWSEIPNPPMLTAKYVIQGSGGAQADVNVSMLNGTGGGVMPNVTRWRVQQLGLPPMTEEEFSKQAQTVDVAGQKGTVVDMTGTDSKTGKKARLVGIILPQANDTWFYKLMGDPQIVEQQKDTFIKFVQTAKFGN